MDIRIKTIPKKMMRYDTAGDYYKRGSWQFRIAKQKNPDEEFSILIHELVEWYLCQKSGITQKQIDEFDMSYKGEDPGLDKEAPYHKQHIQANRVEKMVEKML